jgi:hypothetical protein
LRLRLRLRWLKSLRVERLNVVAPAYRQAGFDKLRVTKLKIVYAESITHIK